MKAILISAVLMALAAGAARGGVSLGATCDGDAVTVHLYVFNGDDLGDDTEGIVVVRNLVGLCDDDERLPAGPFAVPPRYEGASFQFTDTAVTAGLLYEYRAMILDLSGELRPAPGNGDPQPYAFSTCGEAVASRGNLVVLDWTYMTLGLVGCDDYCWLSVNDVFMVDFSLIDQATIDQYLYGNVAVDLYTDRVYVDGMPGGTGFSVTRIEPAPDGACGPVPSRNLSWGAVKELFR